MCNLETMSPSVAVVMLLPHCNMTCSFCVTEDAMGTFDLAQACALLERLRDEGFDNVVLGGGEPTLWPHDVFRLAREAKRRGFRVQLGTNGVRLPEQFESLDEIDRYVLPIDGASADVHNAVRFFRQQHFEVVIDRLERLRAAGKSTTVSTVITRLNQNDLSNVARLLADLNQPRPFVHAWHLYQFIPLGRGGAANRELLALPRDTYDRTCDDVKRMDLGFTIFKRPDMLHSRAVEFFWMHGGNLHRQLGATTRVEELKPECRTPDDDQ
jgi:MoaA/NifB/PqqE/SkfB family radical SAM enzyme